MLQIAKPRCQFKHNLCSRLAGAGSKTQQSVWSCQALRCVSAQCGIRLAAWVGVCPCKWRSSFLKLWLLHFHKGSVNSLSPLPASLFEHASIGEANNRTTQRTTQHCQVHALTPPSSVYPPHVCHRQGLGSLQRLAHAAGHGHTPAPPRLSDFFV